MDAASTSSAFAALEARLGHRFARPALLEEALTHGSAGGRGRRLRRNNERLEFLGDRVLGLAVATVLIERFPQDSEGDLSARQAALVSEAPLAEVARELDLGAELVVARSEAPQGAADRPAILADALEAVIGAIYLDAGWPAALTFVRDRFEARALAMEAPPRDAKSQLQEWTQARGLGLPEYQLLDAAGPAHAPTFEMEVRIPDWPPASGRAASKRAAEQAAAASLLEQLAASDG